MAQSTFSIERRQKRSQETREAINYQLEYLVDHYDLRDLVLADSRGLMLAASCDDDEASCIAAYAPVLPRYVDGSNRRKVLNKLGDLIPGVAGESLSIRQFEMHGEEHFLVALGDEKVCRHTNLYRAVTGIRRIIKETSAAA